MGDRSYWESERYCRHDRAEPEVSLLVLATLVACIGFVAFVMLGGAKL